jgi:transcriptional regulator with XRE-family HTH domain
MTGRRIRWPLLKALKERGFTGRSFAGAVGDHETVVSRIINGVLNPNETQIQRYSQVLGKQPRELFEDAYCSGVEQ